VAELLDCPGGAPVQSSFRQEANAFFVIGRFAEADGGTVRVDAPVGRVDVSLTLDADVEGAFESGDPISVSGRVAQDGDLEATQVRSGCRDTFVAEPDPTATVAPEPPEEAVSNVTPVPTVVPVPTLPVTVVTAPPVSTAQIATPTPAPPRAPVGLPTLPPAPPPLATATPTPTVAPAPTRGVQPAAEPSPSGAIGEVVPPE
jgi:hypothetical protein